MENLSMSKESLSPPKYEDVLKDAVTSEPVDHGMVVYVTVDPVSRPDNEQLVSGVREYDTHDDAAAAATSGDWMGTSFHDKKIRCSFIRKVFLILMCQLAATVGVICMFLFCKPVNTWILSPKNFWFYYVAYGIFLVTYVVLACCKNVRRRWPGNFICLAVFTMSLSCMAGTISSYHDTRIVLVAFGMTAAICLALSLFAIQTKIDFTLCSGALFAFSMIVLFFGVYVIMTGAIIGFQSQLIMTGVWGGLLALFFSLFLVLDIQQVVGGNSLELHPEEYIYGALHIYFDVVFLFLMVLSCSGRSQ